LKFVISGKNVTHWKETTLSFVGIRCFVCQEDIATVATGPERFWSDPNSWPSGKLPIEGENVHIEPGWNMTLDLAETPILTLVRVNGILRFKNDMDISFRAKHIFVRAGELLIGSNTTPYVHNATITLFGEKDSKAIVYDNAIEAGNKLIANVGKIRMYGKQRSHTLVRLTVPATRGSTAIFIEPGMDLVAGDKIALLPTAYDNEASDEVTITEYDTTTGQAKFTPILSYYHWGHHESTAADYNGADMRGEVIVLSRNIMITGEDIESWGAQIVTSDTAEVDTTGNITMRYGSTVLDSVELFKCSQIDTMKAALRFEGAS
jgi:hypothetical protein